MAAFQVAKKVAVVAPWDIHLAVTPVGAEGATEAATVIKLIGSDAGPGPPIVEVTTVIS
jgi:hypothetical protein